MIWTIPTTILTLVFAPELLSLVGADGETLELSVLYFRIVGSTLPILGLAFTANSLLRSVGDAKLSMWSTIIGGIVNAIVDPILIFGMGLDLTGAALASVLSRISVAVIGMGAPYYKHELFSRPHWNEFVTDIRALNSLAIPSMLTNLSAPISSAFATAQMAKFGTDAVAAAAVIGRLTPVAFCGLYGLSGSVGPIASQNVGAGKFDRVRETLLASARFVAIYVLPVAILMFFANEFIAGIFNLSAEASALLSFYTTFIVISYLLFGLQLAANPLFTSANHPLFATMSNVLRDLMLAVPLVFILADSFGARGVLAGQALANAIAGVVAFAVALWMTTRMQQNKNIDFSWSKTRLHPQRHATPGTHHRG